MTPCHRNAFLAFCEGTPPLTDGYPSLRTSDGELWCFLICGPKQAVEHTVVLPVSWDAMTFVSHHHQVRGSAANWGLTPYPDGVIMGILIVEIRRFSAVLSPQWDFLDSLYWIRSHVCHGHASSWQYMFLHDSRCHPYSTMSPCPNLVLVRLSIRCPARGVFHADNSENAMGSTFKANIGGI